MLNKITPVIKGRDYSFALRFDVLVSTWTNIQCIVYASGGEVVGKYTLNAAEGFEQTISIVDTYTIKVKIPKETTATMNNDTYSIEMKHTSATEVKKYPVEKLIQIKDTKYES